MKSLAVLSLAAALAAHAQAPAFEVASIKPNRSMAARNSIHLSKGLVQMENVSLKKVMLNAWGIPDDREYMVDGPGWLATEHFDIEARFPADAPLPQVRQMMQSLLAERFHLALHRETKQMSALVMTVPKTGHKLKPAGSDNDNFETGKLRLGAKNAPLAQLTDFLSRELRMPIVDQTGLTGRFDYSLDINKYVTEEMQRGPGPPPEAPNIIARAFQEQLGLKLV